MKKIEKRQGKRDWLQLLAAILAQWRCPVASTKALDLLYWAMRVILYWRTATTIKMAIKVGPFFHCCFVCSCPGGHWGNMKRVVAQWRRPVASMVALDITHWIMPFILLRCTAMVIKISTSGGAFVCHCLLVCIIIHSYKTILWSIKTNAKLQH